MSGDSVTALPVLEERPIPLIDLPGPLIEASTKEQTLKKRCSREAWII
jgi:hypothetical protein